MRPGGAIVASILALLLCLAAPAMAGELLEVEVMGLENEPLANVEAALGINRRRLDKSLTPELIRELHAQAAVDIGRGLEPFGFYRPQITAELAPPTDDRPSWLASYSIEPGVQIPIVAINLELNAGSTNEPVQQNIADAFTLNAGSPLDHRVYEKAKQDLLKLAKNQGFLDASYSTHRVEVDLASYTASIWLSFESGPRYVIGEITLDQELFAEEYLAQYLVLESGEPYSQAQISQQRSQLSKSGHFQEVAIEVGEPTKETPPAIPLHIRMQPYKANRYRGRISWGSDTDFGVQADWTRRYIGRHGHHFNAGGMAVQHRNRLAADLRYIIPLEPLSGHDIEIAARHESKDLTYKDVELPEGGETRIATNLAGALWHLPKRGSGDFELKTTAGLSLVNETYDVFEVLFGNLPASAQDAIIDIIGADAYSTLSPDFDAVTANLRMSLQRSDNPLYIRRGDFLKLELLGADENLGSNISFWQARINTWNIWPIGDSGRFLLRSAVGYSDAESSTVLSVNFNEMPEYFEFRAGGARSVRGYGYETLFPKDAITGGKHQLIGSVEYEHEIIPDWSAAVFLDGGNAFNDWSDINEKLGAGIGIRWRSPVGLARIDLGFPLDDADDSFQIYITVGPEF